MGVKNKDSKKGWEFGCDDWGLLTSIGYSWDESNPRIQLEPIGTRGYIELVAIKEPVAI